MNRRVVATVDPGADDAGFGFAPETAADRLAARDPDELEIEAR